MTDDPDLPVEVIARVALPTFSHDKMESEAATKLYIRAHTSVPVPKLYFWDSDPNNPVGAEYMIIERVVIFYPSFILIDMLMPRSSRFRERVQTMYGTHLQKSKNHMSWNSWLGT